MQSGTSMVRLPGAYASFLPPAAEVSAAVHAVWMLGAMDSTGQTPIFRDFT
jgi:hypothetical protein